MSEEIYARGLLEKIVSKEELKILEIVWNDKIDLEKKIDLIMEES